MLPPTFGRLRTEAIQNSQQKKVRRPSLAVSARSPELDGHGFAPILASRSRHITVIRSPEENIEPPLAGLTPRLPVCPWSCCVPQRRPTSCTSSTAVNVLQRSLVPHLEPRQPSSLALQTNSSLEMHCLTLAVGIVALSCPTALEHCLVSQTRMART